MSLYRLIYRSRSAEAIDWDVLKSILHKSEQHNVVNGLTGTLLASTTHYLQVLEGGYEPVNETFARIVRDPRHEEIRIIDFSVVAQRLFADWSMRGIGVFEFNQDILQQLSVRYGGFESVFESPLDPWRALAMIHDVALMSQQSD